MAQVREQRAKKVLEEALRDWLEDGYIPSAGELQQAVTSRQEALGDLVRSRMRLVEPIERWSESSAERFNDFLSSFEADGDVLLRSLMDITETGISTLGEWNTRAKSLGSRMEALKSRIDSLVLMNSLTAGFISFVEDGFYSLENVGSDTTANINTDTGEVSLRVDRALAEGSVQGTQIDIRDSQVFWTLIEGGNTRYTLGVPGGDLQNILYDHHTGWNVQAFTRNPQEFRTSNRQTKAIVGELKLALPSITEVSRIALLTEGDHFGGASVVSAQYSVDGYVWTNVSDSAPALSGTGNFIWRFPKTEMAFVKIILSKSAPDRRTASGGEYTFGIRQIKMFSEAYDVPEGGVQFISTLRQPTIAGSAQFFGRCSLEVCEELPEGTSINYFLRANDGVSYTDWTRVIPTNREERMESAPSVDFSAPSIVDSDDEALALFDASLEAGALNLSRTDGAGSLSYRFNGPETTIANFYIPYSDTALSDLVLLRNVGYSAGKFPAASTDLLVGDVECGWGREGEGVYFCEFQVLNPEGLSLDFGGSQAWIDGNRVEGSVVVTPGWHRFKTNRANWISLSGTAPTTLDELKALDPLYPYNHKYLIEGYTFPETFSAEAGIYIGADKYCQIRPVRVGSHNFIHDEFDFGTYAIDVLSGPKTIVLLKIDPSRPSHQNERIRLLYKRRHETYSGVQIKAVLDTQDAERTPSLSYYRIMVK